MHFFDGICGNEKQKAYFKTLIDSGKCAHAYILEAPRGGGKKTFALAAAASLAYADRNLDDRERKCRRILDGASPDVQILTRLDESKRTIGVDAVRDFLSSVYLTPSELGFKMYILDEADRITPQAQNALLKIVEEPPQGVYIFLLCENSLSLLTTVRSRAQKLALQTFDEQELAGYARELGFPGAEDEARLCFAVRMAQGAIGRLRGILENGESEFAAYTAAKKTVEGQASKESYYMFLKSICDAAGTREAFDAFVGYLLSAYGDIVHARCAEQQHPVFFSEDEAQKYAMLFPTEALSASFAAADAVRAELRFNTNLSLAAASLAMRLWKAV